MILDENVSETTSGDKSFIMETFLSDRYLVCKHFFSKDLLLKVFFTSLVADSF